MKNRILGLCLILAVSVVTPACFSIEQEIFLNADGSGELVLHVSLPDLPEEAKSAPTGAKESPEDSLKKFREDVVTNLPPTVKLKEVKEVHQNGSQGFYAVFQFKELKDVQAVLSNFGKQSLKESKMGGKDASVWTVQTTKAENKTVFVQQFYADVSDATPESSEAGKEAGQKKAETGEAAKDESGSQDLNAQLKPVILAMVKLRFVLHAPGAITESNADIVVNGNTALWDCSFAAFANSKKPIEMKAVY